MHILINPLHRPAIVPGVSHSENQCHDQYRSQHHLPPAHPSCPHHAARNAGSDQCARMQRNRSEPCPVHRFRSDASDPREATRTERSLSRIGAVDSALNIFIASRIIALLPALSGDADTAASVDIDLSEFPWPFVVQGHRGAIIEPPRSGGEATPIFDLHDERFFEGFTRVRLNKTDSCQCHRCSYRLARSTPPQLRVSVSRQSRHLALDHSPDPRCDLRSRVYHIGECLLVFISGACRHNEHRDGDGFLFGQCY